MNKLEGKTAVITGGDSGIGLATAGKLVEEGAYVFITGRRQPKLDEAVKQIGKNVTGVQGDVSNLADLDRLYATIQQQKHLRHHSLPAISEAHFDKTFDVNVKGLLFTVQKALPLFKDGGSIILNASNASSKATEGFSIYSASKAAVRSFARTWTVELKHRKIRVNAISPGPIDTPAFRSGFSSLGQNGDQIKAGIVASVPLGRIGTPDEIAKAVSFLASEDSSFITGIELFVDGGLAQI